MVEVIAAEVGVSGCRFNFENAVAHFQNRNVEGATTKVEYKNRFVSFLVNTISKSRSSWLIDNSLHFQTGDCAGILSRLTLRIVEVSRNSDHCTCYLLSQILLSIFFQLAQNHRRDFLRRVFLITYEYLATAVSAFFNLIRNNAPFAFHFAEAAPYEAFRGINRILWINHCLTSCQLTDETLACFGKSNHRWRGPDSFSVCNNGRFSALHYSNDGICSAQIYSDCLAHIELLKMYINLTSSYRKT